MKQYHDLSRDILSRGEVQFNDRTEEYVLGIPAALHRYDLREGFPLVTTKEVNPRLPFEELFWKMRGERNVKSLADKKVHIWTANAFDRYLRTQGLTEKYPKHSLEWNAEFKAYKERIAQDPEFAATAGDLGPVYGWQWRHWRKPTFVQGHAAGHEWVNDEWKMEEVDQLARLIKGIKEKPGSRYNTLNAWNVADLGDMAIGPCPFWHQFTVYGDNLDLTMVQRSCDTYLGIPFNIAQDSLLLKMVAKETGLNPRFFEHSTINTHFYLGVSPRSDFWLDRKNVEEFQRRFKKVEGREGYLALREWYLSQVPEEREGSKTKDHIPFILKQLSFEPTPLPSIELKKGFSLFEAINNNALDVVQVEGYTPAMWNSKAAMAA